ncbi:MAG: hypothetical protein R2873_08395 [Caldilineaceae bacterium]
MALLAQRGDVARIAANYPLVRSWDRSFAADDEAGAATAAQTPAYPWNIPFVGADRVWQTLGVRGEGAVVGGFDTGVTFEHPALVSAYRGYVAESVFEHNYNWFEPNGDLYADGNLGPSASDEPYDCDYFTHGTHTMGTMIGDGGSQETAIGMAPAAPGSLCRASVAEPCPVISPTISAHQGVSVVPLPHRSFPAISPRPTAPKPPT